MRRKWRKRGPPMGPGGGRCGSSSTPPAWTTLTGRLPGFPSRVMCGRHWPGTNPGPCPTTATTSTRCGAGTGKAGGEEWRNKLYRRYATMTQVPEALVTAVAAAVERLSRPGIEGWGLRVCDDMAAAGEVADVSEHIGCTSDTCAHVSHDPAAPYRR